MRVVSKVTFDRDEAEILRAGVSKTHILSDDPERYGEIGDQTVRNLKGNMAEKALAVFLVFDEVGTMQFDTEILQQGLEVLDEVEAYLMELALEGDGGCSKTDLENIAEARKVLSEALETLRDVDDTYNEEEDEEEEE